MQRVLEARVRVEGELVGACGPGMLVLLGVLRGDGEPQARRLAERAARMRFFSDEDGRMNLDVSGAGGGALVVSQFTLAADGRKGRRPSFGAAAPPEQARPLCELFTRRLRELGVPTQTGRFGASMQVELVNDGPVTFVLDEPPPGAPRSSPAG